jgi:hypothetical protein
VTPDLRCFFVLASVFRKYSISWNCIHLRQASPPDQNTNFQKLSCCAIAFAAQTGAHLMKMIALIDRKGAVRAWADRKSSWICNPTGNCFALIEFDGIFTFTGEQIGWWCGDHIRDRYGRVALARLGAKIEGIIVRRPEKVPEPPRIYLPTGRPPLQWLLPPPMKQRAWADFKALFDDGMERVRVFEEKLGAWSTIQVDASEDRPRTFPSSEHNARQRTFSVGFNEVQRARMSR